MIDSKNDMCKKILHVLSHKETYRGGTYVCLCVWVCMCVFVCTGVRSSGRTIDGGRESCKRGGVMGRLVEGEAE